MPGVGLPRPGRVELLADARASAIAPQRVRRALERYERCLSTLSPSARGLLRDRAGLDRPAPATLTRLAAERRTSPMVVRTRIRRAIRDLRQAAARGACQATGADGQGAGTATPTGGPAGGPTGRIGGPTPAAASAHRAPSSSPSVVPSPTTRSHPTEDDGSPILAYVTGSSVGVVLFVLMLIGIVLLLIAGAVTLARQSHWRHLRSSPRGPWRRES